jgi:hypothetical protein
MRREVRIANGLSAGDLIAVNAEKRCRVCGLCSPLPKGFICAIESCPRLFVRMDTSKYQWQGRAVFLLDPYKVI